MDDVIEQAKGGDTNAFQHLMALYHPLVWRTAYAILREPSLVDDACQDIWIDVWRGLRSYTSGQSLRPWLLTIAAHRCQKLLHQRRVAPTSFSDLPVLPDIVDAATPLTALSQSETRQELYQAIAVLPREQHQVVALRYFAELELSEIAITLNIPLGTVKSRLHRAILDLRQRANAQAQKLGDHL